MPVASHKQCKRPKGFSQIASCKAQGLIARTSSKNKGKYIISKKYKKSRSRKVRFSRKINQTNKLGPGNKRSIKK